MILVTTDEIEGESIERVLGLVRGNTVRARHLGKDIMAGFRNVVGGEIAEYTRLLSEARQMAVRPHDRPGGGDGRGRHRRRALYDLRHHGRARRRYWSTAQPLRWWGSGRRRSSRAHRTAGVPGAWGGGVVPSAARNLGRADHRATPGP